MATTAPFWLQMVRPVKANVSEKRQSTYSINIYSLMKVCRIHVVHKPIRVTRKQRGEISAHYKGDFMLW